MKVGILTSSVSRSAGGLYYSVSSLAKALKEECGVNVSVFGLEDCNTKTDIHEWGNIPVKTFSVSGPSSFGYSSELLKSLLNADIDILHVHGIWMYPSVACLLWYQKKGRPYIVSLHGMLNPKALEVSKYKKKIASFFYEKQHLKKAKCLHALTVSEKISIRKYGLHNPICVIPNGIKLPTSLNAPKPEWSKMLDPNTRVILYLGRIHPIKGLANLLIAWKNSREKNPEISKSWVLVLAGWDDGGFETELKSLVIKLSIQESVYFVGPQYGVDKHATYCKADAFVLPSFSEGLPMAVLEAWSYQLPVMMTKECNLHEAFVYKAAVPMEPSPDGIEQGLTQFFNMPPEKRLAVAQNGRWLVQKQFSWTKIATEMCSVYEWMLKGGNIPLSIKHN